jgi:hypothetical protein
MTGIARRGISNAIAMAACAVCLVVAAAVVMAPSVALAQCQAGQLIPSHAAVDRASDKVAWDAARGFEVALANRDSQRRPTCIGYTAEMSPAGRSDGCSWSGIYVPASGIYVPAYAAPEAFVGITGHVVQDSLANIQTCSGQSAATGPEQGMATYPEAVAATRRGWTMDAPGQRQRLPVERVILSQAQPTSLLAQADSRALDAGRLHGPATEIMALMGDDETDSMLVANPELGKVDTRFCRFHLRGLCTYRVSV